MEHNYYMGVPRHRHGASSQGEHAEVVGRPRKNTRQNTKAEEVVALAA